VHLSMNVLVDISTVVDNSISFKHGFINKSDVDVDVTFASRVGTDSQQRRGYSAGQHVIWENKFSMESIFVENSTWFLWTTSFGRRPFYMELIFVQFLHNGAPFWDT